MKGITIKTKAKSQLKKEKTIHQKFGILLWNENFKSVDVVS